MPAVGASLTNQTIGNAMAMDDDAENEHGALASPNGSSASTPPTDDRAADADAEVRERWRDRARAVEPSGEEDLVGQGTAAHVSQCALNRYAA
ncbi:MAG: hypothetical protein U0163_15795 [Gemmatimonadaceae bacterium]